MKDWDTLVKNTYNKIYCLQQQDGCKRRQRLRINVPCIPKDFKRDEIPEVVNGEIMGVSFKSWSRRDKDILGKKLKNESQLMFFWERNFYPHISMIINDLHAKGLLNEGKYKINIDW